MIFKMLFISFLTLLLSCSTSPKALPPTLTISPSPGIVNAAPRPKYDAPKIPVKGPAAVRLYDQHEFMKKNKASDFWALASYYIPQEDGTCAAASIAIILNGLNAYKKATSEEKLVTVKDLIAKVNDPLWVKSMKDKKCYDLDRLAGVTKQALKLFGHDDAKVKVVHADSGNREQVRKDLNQNEKSDHNFIIANFLQGQFTGDPEGTGHVSPVAAYDNTTRRVLILDVDREYYEPYWVTEDIFFAAINTVDDSTKTNRGYMVISEN